jgi:lipopolysaccharide biosynthesis glycosyltransferase
MLIDLARVRAEKSFSAALDFVAEHNEKLLLGDQDALNVTFWGRWKSVGAEWNVQRVKTTAEFAAETSPDRRIGPGGPALVHYITDDKPWKPEVWHPWAWLYWKSLKRTSFLSEVIRAYQVKPHHRLRIWLKWMRDRPRTGPAARA